MTALIKMEQIEKGCVTMELYNYLPPLAFVFTLAFHQDGAIAVEESGREGTGGTWLSAGCRRRKEEVIWDDVNDDASSLLNFLFLDFSQSFGSAYLSFLYRSLNTNRAELDNTRSVRQL